MHAHLLTSLFLYLSIVLVNANRSSRCPLPTLPGGRVKVRSKGRAVTFRCNRRFTYVGEYTDVVCYKGSWFPPIQPKCIKSGCSPLADPENGYLVGLYGGAMAVFECDPGKVLPL